jgi:hypothetical protein
MNSFVETKLDLGDYSSGSQPDDRKPVDGVTIGEFVRGNVKKVRGTSQEWWGGTVVDNTKDKIKLRYESLNPEVDTNAKMLLTRNNVRTQEDMDELKKMNLDVNFKCADAIKHCKKNGNETDRGIGLFEGFNCDDVKTQCTRRWNGGRRKHHRKKSKRRKKSKKRRKKSKKRRKKSKKRRKSRKKK